MTTPKKPRTDEQLRDDLETLFQHLDEEDPARLQEELRERGVALDAFHARIRGIVSQPPSTADPSKSADWRVRNPAARAQFAERLKNRQTLPDRSSGALLEQVRALIADVQGMGLPLPSAAFRNLDELTGGDLESLWLDLQALNDNAQE